MAVLASVVVAAPELDAAGLADIEPDAAEDGMAEPDDAAELAAMELGPAALDADDEAAGAALLELVELPEALLLEPQAAATKAITATPAAKPVRLAALLLAMPGVVDTRTSSS